METNTTQAVGETILYQEGPAFSSAMIYVHDTLVSVPAVMVTDRRIKVGNDSYSFQEVVEARLITEQKRMHRASWVKAKAAWAVFWATIGDAYLGLSGNHYLLLLLLLAPIAGLIAYHVGKTDEIGQVWTGTLMLVGARKKTKMFIGAWYQDTTVIGYDMKLKKHYAMLVEGWQKSHDEGSRRAKLIAEAVGSAIARRQHP